MDKYKDYILIAASSFVSIAAIMVLLAMIEPAVFSLVPGTFPDSLSAAPGDSTSIADMLKKQLPADTIAEASHTDSVLVKPASDSTAKGTHGVAPMQATARDTTSPAEALAAQGIKIQSNDQSPEDALSDLESKRMAQIFDAMDAENAVKILNNMDDHAVKQVITSMKKRQSAKVLAAMNPQQAARILKGRN